MGDLKRFTPVDPDIARASLECIGTLTPIQEIANRSDLRDKLTNIKQSLNDFPPPPIPGPAGAQLLDLLS
jgi:hypothetical protein